MPDFVHLQGWYPYIGIPWGGRARCCSSKWLFMVLLLRGSPQFITQLTAAGYFLPVVQWSSVRRCHRAPLQARRAHPPCRLLHPLHVVQQASRILTYPNGNYLYMAFLYERSDLIGMLQAGSGASERADLIPLLMSPAAAAAIIQLASGVNSFTGYVEVKIDGVPSAPLPPAPSRGAWRTRRLRAGSWVCPGPERIHSMASTPTTSTPPDGPHRA